MSESRFSGYSPAVARQQQPGQVGVVGVDAGRTQGFDHAQRVGGNRLRAGLGHRTGDHDFLAGETQHRDIHLRLGDERRQPLFDVRAQLLDGPAGGLDFLDERVIQRAVGTHQSAVGIDLLLRARWRRQLGVIPHGDVQHIVVADAVFGRGRQQFRRQRLTLLRGAVHGDQLGRDRNQLDPAAFAGTLAGNVAGAQVLTGGKHATLQSETCQH